MTLREARQKRQRRMLAYKTIQRCCVALAVFGLLLVLFSGAIADNPVSTFAMMMIYLMLGLTMMGTGYFGCRYFLELERRERRERKRENLRAVQALHGNE